MRTVLLGAVIASALIGATLAAVFDGPCPTKSVISDFNIEEYIGTWYELYRYENDMQGSGECVTSEVYVEENNVDVRLYNRFLVIEPEFDVSDVNMTGFVSFPGAASIPGQLTLTTSDNLPGAPNYHILATDYDSYSIVWSCDDLDNGQSDQKAWVFSRRYYLVPETESEVLGLIDLLLESSLLRETYNGDDCLGGIEPA